MVAILGYSHRQIANAVKDMYTAVAEDPRAGFHFPVGEAAVRALDYPENHRARLPAAVRESFAGVGCPLRAGAVQPGETVLDIGAGSGADTLLAAGMAGPRGHVVALDLTPAMAAKLKRAAAEAGAGNISVVQASAEHLPLADRSVDRIISNGALNLIPDKRRAVTEMFRVLRPGGRLQLADVVIHRPVTVDCSTDPRLWVECVVGATVEEELLALFREAGFESVEITRHHDYFAHSPSAQTREIAAGFGARSAELSMRRGQQTPGRLQRWLRRLNPLALGRRLGRRGWLGALWLVFGMLACYGTLATVALLGALGMGRVFDSLFWAAATAVAASAIAAVAVTAGIRRHRRPGPAVLAASGAGLVFYALFIRFHPVTELAGFVLLGAAVARDIYLRRRVETRLLGLDSTG